MSASDNEISLDDLTDEQLEIVAEMAENNGYTILGSTATKTKLYSLDVIQPGERGGWKFTQTGRRLAAEYHRRGKAGTIPKRSD